MAIAATALNLFVARVFQTLVFLLLLMMMMINADVL